MLRLSVFLEPLPGLPLTWNTVHAWCSDASEPHRGNFWHVAKGENPCVVSIWRDHQEMPGISALFPSQSAAIWVLQPGIIASLSLGISLQPGRFFFIFKPSVYTTERILHVLLVLRLVRDNTPSVAHCAIRIYHCTPHSPLRPHKPSLCPFTGDESRAQRSKTSTTQLLSSRARVQACECANQCPFQLVLGCMITWT